MKRSLAPSILAEKKRLKMIELGLSPESTSQNEIVEQEHNQTALDIFVALLRKLSNSTSNSSPEENEAEPEEDDSTSEDSENDIFFAIAYSVRQGSRRHEAVGTVEQGEGNTYSFLAH